MRNVDDIFYIDVIRFFKISSADPEQSFSLEVLKEGMPVFDFTKFFHPIFNWGDTVSYPLMVATDHDGKGDISVWKANVPVKVRRRSSEGCWYYSPF